MSAATKCDNCGTTTTDPDQLDVAWFKIQQCGDRQDFCSGECAVAGVQAMQAATDEALAQAQEDD